MLAFLAWHGAPIAAQVEAGRTIQRRYTDLVPEAVCLSVVGVSACSRLQEETPARPS